MARLRWFGQASPLQSNSFSSPFRTVFLVKRRAGQPTLQEWGATVHFLGSGGVTDIIWKSSAWEVCLSVQLFTCISVDSWSLG